MKYFFCLMTILAGAVSVNAQPDFYPVPKPVKKDLVKAYTNHLYSGCAEGNCTDGKGKWITVYVTGFGGTGYAAQYLRNVNLVYYITTGVFKDSGKVCEGVQTQTYYPLTRAGEMDDYSPGNPPQRMDTTTAGIKKGIFDLSENAYYSNGEVELAGLAKRFNYKKATAWTQWDKIRYATVEYNATDIYKKFTGIVDEYLRPVYGVATYQDGGVFSGFFIKNTKGPGYYFKTAAAEKGVPADGAEQFDFMPDMRLLRQAFSSFYTGTTHSIEVGWGDQEQELSAGMPKVDIYRELVRYGGGSGGWLYGADGIKKDPAYTGKGLYYYSENLFYFGAFENGRPDGKGFLYYRHVNNDTTISPSETFFKYGNFVQGFFNDGYFIYQKAGLLAKKVLPQKTIDEPLFGLLATEANKNNTAALVELGDIYLEGRTVKADITKAVGYFKRAVTYGNAKAALKLGTLYEKGDNSKGLQRDSLKAGYYYKRGAQMKESSVASAEAVKNCRVNYFLFTYPYLTKEQAGRFTLNDEYNLVSELSLLVTAKWKQQREEERRMEKQQEANRVAALSVEEAKDIVGKIYFKPQSYNTGRNKWTTVTIFYVIMGVEGNNASVTYSSTNDVTVRSDIKPVRWFTDYKNGFTEAKKMYHLCRTCNASGFVQATSTFKHTNDYEYTLGKKITYTSTTTTNVHCGKCYGAGFCPSDGSAPEWPDF